MVTYTIDQSQRLIKVRMSGPSSCADMERYCAQLYNDPKYDVTFNSLFQADPDTDGLIMEEIPKVRVLLELVAETEGACKKWAVVLPSRFKRTIVEFLFKGVRLKPIEMRFFDDEKDALAWLN